MSSSLVNFQSLKPRTEIFFDHERNVLPADQPQQVQQLRQRIQGLLQEDVGASGHPEGSVRRIALLDRLPQGQDRIRGARLGGEKVGKLFEPECGRERSPVVQPLRLWPML